MPHLGAAPASSYAQAERQDEVKSLVERALVGPQMFTVSIDYKQTVTLSFAVTVDTQYQGKMEQVRIVVIGPQHSCLHTMAQLDS